MYYYRVPNPHPSICPVHVFLGSQSHKVSCKSKQQQQPDISASYILTTDDPKMPRKMKLLNQPITDKKQGLYNKGVWKAT